MTKYILILCCLTGLCISCSKSVNPLELSLNLSENNRTELETVLQFYSKPKDSLKLRAAKYLIENMKYHSYIDNQLAYAPVFEKAKKTKDSFLTIWPNASIAWTNNIVKAVFKKSIDSLESDPNFVRSDKRVFDITSITSDFLIENIELAFEAYEKNPLKLCNSFDDFLQYILPYRALNEPLEQGKRKEFYNNYKWALDSLKHQSLDTVVKQIYSDLRLSANIYTGKKYNYKGVQSLSQIETTGLGSCGEITAYFVSVLRSIGIPSGIDENARWGVDYKSGVHSWAFYLKKNGFEAINISFLDYKSTKEKYKLSSLTKVNRNQFHNEPENVTHLYRNTNNLEIEILWNTNNAPKKNIFLGVFNSKLGWDKIASPNVVEDTKAYFRNIGTGLIYVVFYEENGEQHLLNYPFKIKKDGTVKYYNNDSGFINKVTVLRKFPPYFVRTNKVKLKRIRSLNNAVLQGSNTNSEKDFKDLYVIRNYNTTQNIQIKLDKKFNYKYFRLKGTKEVTHLANFKLLDISGNVIENWQDFKKSPNNETRKLVVDNDPLTFIENKNLVFTYLFEKPVTISGFEIQARNDGNHIDIGDSYELFFWDKEWVSLGQQKAKDTLLSYKKVPKNAIFWLRNNTKGKEEFIFTFDENTNQFWTGVSEYSLHNLDDL